MQNKIKKKQKIIALPNKIIIKQLTINAKAPSTQGLEFNNFSNIFNGMKWKTLQKLFFIII